LSSYFAGNATGAEKRNAGSHLSYSYQTCGYLNTFTDITERRSAALKGMKLRVAFPGDDDSGYTLVTALDGSKQGSYVSFMRRLSARYEFKFIVQNLSASSKAKYPKSSFTACVHDVAVNHTDLCIANFWLTPERRLMASMTAPVSSDIFYLGLIALYTACCFLATCTDCCLFMFKTVTHRDDDYDLGTVSMFLNNAGKVFVPFQPNLWVAITAVSLYAAMCLLLVESRALKSNTDTSRGEKAVKVARENWRKSIAFVKGSSTRSIPSALNTAAKSSNTEKSSAVGTGRELLRKTSSFLPNLKPDPETPKFGESSPITNGVYEALISIMSATPGSKSETLTFAGCIVNLGFGFFILTFVVAFTGATATSLISNSNVQAGSLGSVSDAMTRGAKVCAMDAQASQLRCLWPGLKLITVETTEEGLAALDAGKCAAVVIYEDAWTNLQAAADKRHCNKVQVGTPLYSEQNGMPVREDLNSAISWAIADALAEGWYAQEETTAKSMFWAESSCQTTADVSGRGYQGISIWHFSGPLCITIIGSTFGLLLSVFTEITVKSAAAFTEITDKTRAHSRADSPDLPPVCEGEGEGELDEGDVLVFANPLVTGARTGEGSMDI
jgi:hypothetical protein